MDRRTRSRSAATAALRWLSRGERGGARVARIVHHAQRAGRLRLALLTEELVTSVAVDGVGREALFAVPVPRSVDRVLAEAGVFRARLGLPAWRSLHDPDALRAACAACVDELVAGDGASTRLALLGAHVALCAGRGREAAARLASCCDTAGIHGGRVWLLRLSAARVACEDVEALAVAHAALEDRPRDPWVAVAAALAGVQLGDRELSGRAFGRVRELGARAHVAARRAMPILADLGWSTGASREAFAVD